MSVKAIVTTLLILFSWANYAQDKKMPNEYETRKYIEKYIKEGYEARNKTNLPTDNKNSDVTFLGVTYTLKSYPYEYHFYNEKFGTWEPSRCVNHDSYEDIDFKKLKSVELGTGDEGYVIVYITFETAHIRAKRVITNNNIYVRQQEWTDDYTNSFWVPIPNDTGSFDRFKKALFHYKDLLIEENKNKLANDPFGN